MIDRSGDTICAISSPPGGAPRGVVRISGAATIDCLRGCFSPWAVEGHAPRAMEGSLALPGLAPGLPATLWLWPTARSYTREPCGELHTIGSPPLLEALVARLCELGARLARPGEFTLRAFLAGRLDLTQAEAVLGVIEARSGRQLERALAQLAGNLARPLMALRCRLLDLLADVEAGLDFAEEDLPFVSRDVLAERLSAARESIAAQLAQLAARQVRGDEPVVVLAGPPNAGKSSLFNALTGGAALVSPQAGTTRDYLEARCDLGGGVACRLFDTAGIEPHASLGPAMVEAQRLSLARRAEADLVVYCVAVDATETATPPADNRPWLAVRTKSDLVPRPQRSGVSARTGEGLDVLRARVRERLEALADAPDAVTTSAARCRESLAAAGSALRRAEALAQRGGDEELLAVELRLALEALGEVVGAVYQEDLLDRLFARFCIGK